MSKANAPHKQEHTCTTLISCTHARMQIFKIFKERIPQHLPNPQRAEAAVMTRPLLPLPLLLHSRANHHAAHAISHLVILQRDLMCDESYSLLLTNHRLEGIKESSHSLIRETEKRQKSCHFLMRVTERAYRLYPG